jgi:hypothetical protein
MTSKLVGRVASMALDAAGVGVGRGPLVLEVRAPAEAAAASRLARRVLVRLESAGGHGLPLALVRADPGAALLDGDDLTVVVLLVDPSAAVVEAVGEVLAELEWTGVIVANDRVAAQAAGLGFVRAAEVAKLGVRLLVERDGVPSGELAAPGVVLGAARGVGRIASRRTLRRLVVDEETDVLELVAWLRRDEAGIVARRARSALGRLARRAGLPAGAR